MTDFTKLRVGMADNTDAADAIVLTTQLFGHQHRQSSPGRQETDAAVVTIEMRSGSI
jgi:hypothetical protein